MIKNLKKNSFYISFAFIYIFIIVQITLFELQISYLIFLSAGVLLIIGIRYPLIGILFSFSAINSFFNLIPRTILQSSIINKTWDFGFFYLLVIGVFATYRNWHKYIDIKIPLYFRFFLIYILVFFVSFVFTIAKYPFPLIDAIRTFRYHFGYLFTPILIFYFTSKNGKLNSNNFDLFLKILYYISFALLSIYIFQFLTKIKIFHGYNREFNIQGMSFLRSIPNFLSISYFFLWFNISAWFTDKKMYPAGVVYIAICLLSTFFTFTRGIYLSVVFSLCFLIALLVFKKTLSNVRVIASVIVILTVIFTASFTEYLNPFFMRFSTIELATVNKKQSTLWYRVNLIKDRIKITNRENVYLGLGFVHNKYGHLFGKFIGNYDEDSRGPSLECADIAFGNIIYRTGWIGIFIFTLFAVFTFIYLVSRFRLFGSLNQTEILEIAAILEIIRNIIQMVYSDAFTGNTIHNQALLFGISIILYNINNSKFYSNVTYVSTFQKNQLSL